MSDDPRGDVCRLNVWVGDAAHEAIQWGHMMWHCADAKERERATLRFREAVAKINQAVAEFDAPADEPTEAPEPEPRADPLTDGFPYS